MEDIVSHLRLQEGTGRLKRMFWEEGNVRHVRDGCHVAELVLLGVKSTLSVAISILSKTNPDLSTITIAPYTECLAI